MTILIHALTKKSLWDTFSSSNGLNYQYFNLSSLISKTLKIATHQHTFTEASLKSDKVILFTKSGWICSLKQAVPLVIQASYRTFSPRTEEASFLNCSHSNGHPSDPQYTADVGTNVTEFSSLPTCLRVPDHIVCHCFTAELWQMIGTLCIRVSSTHQSVNCDQQYVAAPCRYGYGPMICQQLTEIWQIKGSVYLTFRTKMYI